MHQPFVTMATHYCRDIFMVKALLKLNVKFPWLVWAWNQKPHRSTALRGPCWDQNMALKPRYFPAIHGPLGAELNDWWITLLQFSWGTAKPTKWHQPHEDSDQPVQSDQSSLSAWRSIGTLASNGYSMPSKDWSVCVDDQADLSPYWAHIILYNLLFSGSVFFSLSLNDQWIVQINVSWWTSFRSKISTKFS